MIAWVESQSVAAITVLVFGFCYLLAALVFAAALAVAQRPVAAALKATSPAMLTPLSVIAGLLIAFLAARVWANVDRANGLVAQEASAIRECVVLAEALPSDPQHLLRDAIASYLRFVEEEDFPAMFANRATPRRPPALANALATVLRLAPANHGEQLVQERAAAAIERALEARRSRILLSRASIAPVQWVVVVLLAVLILLVVAMLHLDRRAALLANLLLFSTAFAACLVLLAVNDRPFATGGFTVEPHALREIVVE